MKKLFLSLLTLCLAMPFSAWADTSEHESDETGEHSGALENGDIWDDEQEEDLGSIVPSSVQLEYKILTAPQGTAGEEGYVNGTVELDNIYAVTEGSSVGALYIPHEIQVVTVSGTSATVNLYTVVAIANNAFRVGSSYSSYNNTITSVSIPYTVTSIGQYAFYNNNRLSSVVFALDAEGNSQLETIGMWAFYNNIFTSVTIPNSVTTIQTASFYFCRNLTSVYIPSSVEQVRMQAFYGCSALTTVTMSGATTLGDNAFGECTSLNAIVLEGGPGENGGSESGAPFAKDNGEEITLYVETGRAAEYLASAWETDLENDTDETLSWNFNEIEISANAYSDSDEVYYATYYTDADGEFYTDVTTYIVTGDELTGTRDDTGILDLQEVSGTLPEGAALLISSTASGTTYYYHPYEVGEAQTIGSNMLYGSHTSCTTYVPDADSDDYYFYKLSRNNAGDAGSVGFYFGAEGGVPYTTGGGKAWLAIPKSASPAKGYTFGGGETTGITAIEAVTETAKKGIYTIGGVRVNDMSKAGLYIVDGKKVIVK